MKLLRRVFRIFLKFVGGLVLFLILILVVGAIYQSYWDNREDKKFTPPGEFVEINGRKIHYVKKGDEGPTVIFEPGVQFWSTSWSLIQSEISKTAVTYSYDRGGMGFSDPLESIDQDTYIEDLYSLIVELDMKTPVLFIGHSLGGVIVNAFYNKYPEMVDGMVLIEPGNPDDVTQWEIEVKPIHVKLMGLVAKVGGWRLFYRNRMIDDGYDPEIVEEFKHLFAKPKVARATAQSGLILKPLMVNSIVSSYGNLPVEVIYTENFTEVGTSFDSDEEKAAFIRNYTTFWHELPEKSEDSRGTYLIPGANHSNVVLNPQFAYQVSERINNMIEYLKIRDRVADDQEE